MGRVIHFEIHAQDPERCSRFYEAVFGWRIAKWDGPVDYWLVTSGPDAEPGINGAIVRRTTPAPTEGQPLNAFANTIQVDSIEDAERAVSEHGGTQVEPREEIPGIGRISYFKDTEGNVFGALEPAAEEG
jgi:predicted enzyme related to lactoylglutathione lyase